MKVLELTGQELSDQTIPISGRYVSSFLAEAIARIYKEKISQACSIFVLCMLH
jgi:hypothetical protein